MSITGVVKYTRTSKSFVKKWIDRYTLFGNVDDLPDRGKTRSTTKKEDIAMVKIFEKNPQATLREAKEKLAKKKVDVSISTISRRLKESKIRNKATIIKPLLTENHCKKRLEWAKANIDRDWKNIIFTDESTFYVRNYTRRAWSKKGEVVLQRSVKHPLKVNVYGCFSAKGFGKLIMFTEILDATKMIDLYKNGLLKSAEMLYGKNNTNWILQEDNDPKHRSRLCTERKTKNAIRTMDWPLQSPDANPIENVWALMKQKMRKTVVKDLKSFKLHLIRTWNGLTQEYAQKLADSCERRCHLIINNNGDWIAY